MTAVISPIPVPPQILAYDLWVLLATTALLMVFAMTRWTLSRRESLVFIAGYAGYVVLAGFWARGVV